MTEHEWLSCTDPVRMIYYLRGKTSHRKLLLFARAAGDGVVAGLPPWYAALAATRWKDPAEGASLLREILGNPFQEPSLPPVWPTSVLTTASALNAGEDCAFALHDALLDVGCDELAKHFLKGSHHPTGCWVVDLILTGKGSQLP